MAMATLLNIDSILTDYWQHSEYCRTPYPSEVFVLADEHTSQLVSTPHPMLTIPAREDHKQLATIETIWDFLHRSCATRQSLLVCVGGGITTDMGGFAAATFKRGIRYINIPTSLLAMVDAAEGGKTGFNRNGIKNEIGCFYPPLHTIIQPTILRTLPAEEFLSGWAEMLKHALIADGDEWIRMQQFDIEEYFRSISSAVSPDLTEAEQELQSLLNRSMAIKRHITTADPFENGLRKVLNFGHTIGHALEAHALHLHQPIRHGYAVAYGMLAELYLSHIVLGMNADTLRTFSHLVIELYGKIAFSCKDFDQLLQLMQNDKKNIRKGEINFTLLRSVGQPEYDLQVAESHIKEALEYLFTL